ncbi:hypothetical protein Ddc_14147 [Ditylenchus destructor]|nr:hypothetical protein Ddc_14147 [Ditylenchus destructor]
MSSDLRSYYKIPDHTTLFNSSASFTYIDFSNSTIYGDIGDGHLGSDFLGIGDEKFQIIFNLIKYVAIWWPKNDVDGFLGLVFASIAELTHIIGLSSVTNWQSIPLVKQLRKSLDSPVISVWKQQTNITYLQNNSSYVLTLGGYDTSNCANEWSSVPQLTVTKTCVEETTAAAVHVNSITTTFKGTDVRIALNKTMFIDYNCIANTAHSYEYGYMPYYMKFFFTEAVQAVLYNDPEYIMDCEAEIAGKLILHIGDWSSSANISLSGTDLAMRYEISTSTSPAHKYSCFLPILGYNDDSCNSICLPPTVWNNYCYAYNFVTKEAGFSKSVTVQTP